MATGLYVCKFNSPVTSIEDNKNILEEFFLGKNYPNPFNPNTRIKFTLNTSGFTTLKVYNGIGQEKSNLISEEMSAGTYEVNFDATGLPSGTYFARLTSGNQAQIIKMILIK